MDFLIARDDLGHTRFEEGLPLSAGTGPGGACGSPLRADLNNITYAKFGEAMNYWDFFPAPEGWGRMPVWASPRSHRALSTDSVDPPLRLPAALDRVAGRTDAGRPGRFVDGSLHRAALPAAYNGYTLTSADPVYEAGAEDEQMLLRPLYFTSWLLDDFLRGSELFGAPTVVLSSASSKTASGLAYLLSRDGAANVIGLTSSRSAEFTRGLGVYDHVIPYDELEGLPDGRAVYVDMAGDAELRGIVHRHFGERLRIRPSSEPPTTTASATSPMACRAPGRRSSSRPTGSPSAGRTGACRASNSGSPTPGGPLWSGSAAGSR